MCRICKKVKINDLVKVNYGQTEILALIKIIGDIVLQEEYGHTQLYGISYSSDTPHRRETNIPNHPSGSSFCMFDSIRIIKHDATEKDLKDARIIYFLL